jgi:hypothetical protein
MQLPLATDVTSLTFDAGDGTTFPYDQVSTPDNIRYWSITGVRVDSSVAFADPNVFVYVVIVTDIGAGGTPIGVPHIWGGYLPTGGIDFLNHLDGPYGDQAVPERSGPIAAVRFEVYCCSRKNQTTLAWTDPTCSTKQTHLNGTSDHIDVTVAVGGATPASLIKGHPVLGKGLFYNVGNGNLDLGVTAASIGLVDADFENDGTGWVFGLGAHINTDPMYVQSGAKSVQITTSSADGYAWSPPFGVDKDQEIFVEIYAVAVGVTTALLRLWIAFYDGAGTYIGDGGSVSLTPTYAHPTDTGFVRVWNHGVSSDPSVAAARIILDIVPNGGADPDTGVYYVDHVSERPQTPFGPGQTRDNHGGVKVLVAGPIYNDIANAVNIRIAPDFVVSSIGGFSTLGVGFIDLVKATGFGGLNPDGSSIFAGGGGSAPFTVNKIGVNYLAVGDALFAGTATFAYFSGGVEGGKVTINSLGITIANKITSPTVTLTLAASGATIANGANNVQVTAFGMIVVVGATIPVQIDATGILLENGFSSVSITASAVTITNGVLNTPVINVVNGTVTAQINDVAVSGSPGLVVQDSSTGYTAGVGYNFISIAQLVAGVNTFAQLTPGALTAGTSTGQGATLTPSIFSMTNLRSTDPGAGSKEIWYDPADGNRLKYRP